MNGKAIKNLCEQLKTEYSDEDLAIDLLEEPSRLCAVTTVEDRRGSVPKVAE